MIIKILGLHLSAGHTDTLDNWSGWKLITGSVLSSGGSPTLSPIQCTAVVGVDVLALVVVEVVVVEVVVEVEVVVIQCTTTSV